MASFDCSGIPRCTIDFPPEFSAEEISSLADPINLLLKSSYLIGTTLETETAFDSLFDIAEEIAGVEACGFLLTPVNSPDTWEFRIGRRVDPLPPPEKMSFIVAPASLAARFGKAVSMDPDWGSWSGPICEAWASRSLVVFPLRREREVIGALVFGKRDSHPFSHVQIKLLWALAMQAENHVQLSDAATSPSFYSFLDPLTHLYNRRYFDNQLEKEILRSRRTGNPFSLLMLDIDGFKSYNDRFLHASGDIALQEFAEILGGSVREVDTVSRLGGDEFALVLLESAAEGAGILGKRLIERFRRHPLPGAGESRSEHLSASIGIASFPADSFDRADLLAKAERALHLARSQGGDRVCLHHETAENGTLVTATPDLPIRKVFDAGRSVVDMDRFLEILLFTGMQGLGAGRGSIVVKDPGGDFSLRASVGFGRHEENIAAAGPIRAGAVTSWVVEHQIPLVVSGPSDSPVPMSKRKNGYHSESFLSIPLTHAGRTLGALHLTNRKEHQPFTPDDLKAFSPIASQIAAILDQGMGFRENVRSFSLSILGSLSDTLELRFPFLSGHATRVRDLSVRTGERMGLDGADLDSLRTAAELHDIGIVGVPGNILSKKRRLNEREMDMTRKHAFLGSKMLEGIPSMETARRAILEHHENFDGTGYPFGLRGQDISVPARILHVAEFYDSMVSDRPHRAGMPPSEALEMIRTGSGTLFDPEVAALF
jgi:diguanylate cyclase (GGDEF)-like protein